MHDLHPVLDHKQSGGGSGVLPLSASPSSILCSVRTGFVGVDRTVKMEMQ